MKKKIISLLLCGLMTAGLCACRGQGGDLNSGSLSDSVPSQSDSQSTSSLPEDADNLFVSDGRTEYRIVYDEEISSTEVMAVSEFADLFYQGTGMVIGTVTDEQVAYGPEEKYICIGKNSYSESAGVVVDSEKVGSNGYHLETKGNSAFILGGGDWGTIWGVYDFLGEQLGYEFFYSDEISFDEEKCQKSALIEINKDESPDWEWRIAGDGEGVNNKELRLRMRMVENNDVWTTNGKISAFHTFFNLGDSSYGFVPPADCLAEHKNWYNLDYDGAPSSPTSLCFSRDPEGLCEQVLSGVIDLIGASGNNNSVNIIFCQLDNADWCYCPECSKVMDKYGGSPSATQVLFMKNYLGPAVESYVSENCPEKDVIIYMYAYWVTKAPPVFSDSQISELRLPDNCGVQYCTDFPQKTPVVDLPEYSYTESWSKITSNFMLMDYAENFAAYMRHFDDYNKLQSNIEYFYELGGKVRYNMMAYGNLANSDWSRLHMYLESHLSWDIHADVNALTDRFFENYYKDAAPVMKEWFYAYRSYSVLFESGNPTGGSLLPLEQCRAYEKFAEQAYSAILKYKYSDPELYDKLYDRITLETLCYRYNYLESYQYAIEDLKEFAESFRNDCGHFGIQRISESISFDTWYLNAGLGNL